MNEKKILKIKNSTLFHDAESYQLTTLAVNKLGRGWMVVKTFSKTKGKALKFLLIDDNNLVETYTSFDAISESIKNRPVEARIPEKFETRVGKDMLTKKDLLDYKYDFNDVKNDDLLISLRELVASQNKEEQKERKMFKTQEAKLKAHLYISLAKSFLRICAGLYVYFGNIAIGGLLIVLAEVLGIIEELVI